MTDRDEWMERAVELITEILINMTYPTTKQLQLDLLTKLEELNKEIKEQKS